MPDKHEVGGSTPLEPTSRQCRQPCEENQSESGEETERRKIGGRPIKTAENRIEGNRKRNREEEESRENRMKKAETKVKGSKQEEIRQKARKNGAKAKGKLEGSRKPKEKKTEAKAEESKGERRKPNEESGDESQRE